MSKIGWNQHPELQEAEVIYTRPHYSLVITPLDWSTSDNGKDLGCYCVMNTEYKTIESTANSLAIMIRAMIIMDQELVEITKELNAKEVAPNDSNVITLR